MGIFSKPQSGNVIIHKVGPLVLAQKERGLKLSEQFDEKILQVLTRVSYSALEIPLYAWAHARRNWSVMRRTTLKLQPGGGGGGGGGKYRHSLMPNMPCGTSGGFGAVSVTWVFYGTGLLAVRTVGVVNLKLAWVEWAI